MSHLEVSVRAASVSVLQIGASGWTQTAVPDLSATDRVALLLVSCALFTSMALLNVGHLKLPAILCVHHRFYLFIYLYIFLSWSLNCRLNGPKTYRISSIYIQFSLFSS